MFLQELSATIDREKHVALIVDNAGWHKAGQLAVPDNITLIPLPPYSPELNAMEQAWEWMRSHYLSNQCYENYDQIVEKACEAWNEFSNSTELVRSIMHRDWVCLP